MCNPCVTLTQSYASDVAGEAEPPGGVCGDAACDGEGGKVQRVEGGPGAGPRGPSLLAQSGQQAAASHQEGRPAGAGTHGWCVWNLVTCLFVSCLLNIPATC